MVADIIALISYSVPCVFKQKDYGFEMNGIKTNLNFIYKYKYINIKFIYINLSLTEHPYNWAKIVSTHYFFKIIIGIVLTHLIMCIF